MGRKTTKQFQKNLFIIYTYTEQILKVERFLFLFFLISRFCNHFLFSEVDKLIKILSFFLSLTRFINETYNYDNLFKKKVET